MCEGFAHNHVILFDFFHILLMKLLFLVVQKQIDASWMIAKEQGHWNCNASSEGRCAGQHSTNLLTYINKSLITAVSNIIGKILKPQS